MKLLEGNFRISQVKENSQKLLNTVGQKRNHDEPIKYFQMNKNVKIIHKNFRVTTKSVSREKLQF